MIDFVKFEVLNANTKALLQNNCLNFIGSFSKRTGEVGNKYEAKFKGLKFVIHDGGRTFITGSIHKYMNEGIHNYNDFTNRGLMDVLIDLRDRFKINLSNCILHNVEVGVNISLDMHPQVILDNLLVHKCEKFKDVFLKSGNYKQASYSQYYIKIYDKGLHYNLSQNLMRVELKFKKMQILNHIGFTSLQDLLGTNLQLLEDLLLKGWSNVLLYDDTIKIQALTSYQRSVKVHQWKHAGFWMGCTKNQRYRERKAYLKCVEGFSNNLHEIISKSIASKWRYLAAN